MRKRIVWRAGLLVIVLALFAMTGTAQQEEQEDGETIPPDNIAIIMDASGSMRQFIGGGQLRIDVAKDAISELVAELPAGVNTSLWAYGHRLSQADPAASCRDIEEVIPLGPLDAPAFSETVQGLNAIGYTPIADTLEQVAASLPPDENNLIVLMSDGEESCGGDPCAVAEALADSGANLVVNTIGFAADEATRTQLQCIAEASGGIYFEAQDAEELFDSFQQASQPQPTLTLVPTDTPQNTPTLLPTNTFSPTDTPQPTPTLLPTNTPGPSVTPQPSPTPPATITPITATPTRTPELADLQESDLPFNLSNTPGESRDVRAAVDRDGRLHVLWFDVARDGLVHRLRTPDGLWTDTRMIAASADFDALTGDSGRLVPRPDGAMCVLFQGIVTPGDGPQVFTECFLNDNWDPREIVLDAGPNNGVEAAHDSDNSLQLLVREVDGGVRHHNSGTQVNPEPAADTPNLAMSSNWAYHVTLLLVDATGTPRIVHRYSTDQGATWTDAETISDDLPVTTSGTLAADMQSRIHVAFNSDGAVIYRWWASYTSGWSDPVTLSDAAGSATGDVALAIGLDGNVHAAWNSEDGLVYARQIDGAWTDARLIAPNAALNVMPALAVAPDGTVHLMFQDASSDNLDLLYTRPE